MKKLTQKVIEQLGYEELTEACKEELLNISNHGIAGGYGQFVYYYDTSKFFDDNKDLIIKHLKEDAKNFDTGLLEMISHFNCLNGDYSIDSIAETIYGKGNDDSAYIKNALAWHAAENVANHVSWGNE